jgi:catechol 2,3-dioxygenase-like lactoylglutathione lyase family enzyme
MDSMITNIALFTLYVTDQDESKKFYIDKLGFEERADVTWGAGYRWVTIGHPAQPELQVTLMTPAPPLDDEVAEAIRRSLANGTMGGFGLQVDDCRATFDTLVSNGVDVVQPPADRPYGVEAVIRDNSGNWLVLVEPKQYTADDFKDGS